MRTNLKWRLLASLLLTNLLTYSGITHAQTEPVTTIADPATQFRQFNAEYLVYRAGKKHGEANRYLKFSADRYQMGYSSDISWLIFSDKRQETSEFLVSITMILQYEVVPWTTFKKVRMTTNVICISIVKLE